MEASDFSGEIRRVAGLLLAHPEAAVPAELNGALLRFAEASRKNHSFEPAGEMARSLRTLLADCEGQILDHQTRIQVTSIIQSLFEALDADGAPRQTKDRTPLVTPIPPSTQQINNRIVLYVDNSALLLMLRESLFEAGFTTTNVACVEDLLRIDKDDCPAAIIADLSLCQMNPHSGEVFSQVRRHGTPPPHLFCLASSNDIPARLEAVRLGATRFFSKPPDIRRLIAVLKGVTGQTPTQPFKALLVDDDRLLCEIYELALNDAGVETLSVHDPLQAPYLISQFKPDVIVSDIYMPGCNGLELLAVLRQDDSLADTPVIFLSSDNDIGCRLEALDLGGDDFLVKPFDNSLFIATVITRAKRARALKRSRSEYRHVLERMREMERHLPEAFSGVRTGDAGMDVPFPDLIDPEDYTIHDIGHKDSVQ